MRALITILVAAAITLGWALGAPEAQALLQALHSSLDYSTTALLAGYLTEEATAKELSVTPRTLKRWRKNRTGPAVTYLGIRPMYRRESVLAWLLSREQKMVRTKSHRPRVKRSEERVAAD